MTMPQKARVADHLLNLLIASGLNRAFSVTGRGSLFLNDAAAKAGLNTTFPLHEQAAGFAACAATSLSGTPTLCIVSTGSGATNVVTPLLTAFQDSLPIVVLSGQNQLRQTNRGVPRMGKTYGEQEADIVNIVSSICEQSLFLAEPAEGLIEASIAIEKHFRLLNGPLWIDVPLDVQSSVVEFSLDEVSTKERRNRIRPPAISGTSHIHERARPDLAEDKSELASSATSWLIRAEQDVRRPVLLIGERAPRIFDPKTLSEIVGLGLPVVTDSGGNGLIDSGSYRYFGSIAAQGFERSAFEILNVADLILMVGVVPRSTLWGHSASSFFPNAIKVAIVPNSETDDHRRFSNHVIELESAEHSTVDSHETVRRELRHLAEQATWTEDELAAVGQRYRDLLDIGVDDQAESDFDIRGLAQRIGDLIEDDSVVIVDSGYADVIFGGMARLRAGQTLLRPFAQGSMGYALPAAVGAATVNRTPVYVFVGDGSLMMNVQELATLKSSQADVRIYVLNNNGYGIIRKRQITQFRRRQTGVDSATGLPSADFKLVAGAFGYDYRQINTVGELKESLTRKGLAIYELPTLGDQPYIQAKRRTGCSDLSFEALFAIE